MARGGDFAAGGDQLFDDVVRQIRSVLRRNSLERALAIGELVLDRFFEGSVAAWRERRNHKNNSVRRLAARADCPLSRSAISRAIGIYAVTTILPSIVTLDHIEASHIGVVLPLQLRDQERWLWRASSERLSVRQLKDAIHEERRGKGERRGRPKAPAARRALSATRASLHRLAAVVAALADIEFDAAADVELLELAESLSVLQRQLSAIGQGRYARRRDSGVWPALRDAHAEVEKRSPQKQKSATS